MSLSAKYQAFLASPNASALADDASLHYIPTLTSISTAVAIVKHFAAQDKQLKRKGNKVLSAIESADAVSLDVEATIEFVTGGGAFLPQVDDNFISDRTVTFPTVHMVHFDNEQKISQIRLYWDQGSLLKQVEVMGRSAKNWPIRDGKDQARLIASSASALVRSGAPTASSRRSNASRGQDDVTITERPTTGRSSRSSTTNAMNDPHASLSLFERREESEDIPVPSSRPIAQRVQSAKPPPREYSELFVGENVASPSPGDRIPKKNGGGKSFKANRLFDDEETVPTPMSVKTSTKKYNHFDFGEGEDAEATPKVRESRQVKSKHQSQWDFDDFVTPEKTKPKVLGQAVRHFGWSDDEDEGSPVRHEVVHKARPDQAAHFEFEDDGTPEGQRKAPPAKGRLQNKGMGLYRDHVTHSTSDDEGDNAYEGDSKRPLGDVTTAVRNENRKKDFGAQWEINDNSPAADNTTFDKSGNGKILKSAMATNWEMYEQSPEQSKKENVNSRAIKTAGNGMGGRKGTGATWSFGGGEEEEYTAPVQKPRKNARAAEANASHWDF